MMSDNSTENIFRFMQLRAAAPVSDGNTDDLLLNDRTPLAMQLVAAEQSERSKIADAFLRKSNLTELIGSEVAQRILMTVKDLRDRGGSVEDLGNKVGSNKTELGRIRDSASDVLLAAKIANWAPAQFSVVENLFRSSSALLNHSSSIRIEKYYTRAIPMPETLQCNIQTLMVNQNNHAKQEPQKPLPSNNRGEDLSAEQIYEVTTELMLLSRPDTLRTPSKDDNEDTVALSLNEKGMKLLKAEAKTVLDQLGLQPDKYPLDVTVSRLEVEMARRVKRSARSTSVKTIPTELPEERPYIKDVGVADLLVVKQHLKGYERVDIAHIENVLAGEKKVRTHRALERTEETFTIEREITKERQTELETAERFELNKETAQTVKRDQEFGFGLTLSGKYGPTVEFSSNLKASSTSSTEESTKSAMRYGKDIMERSLERVVERVRTEQVRRLIREQEETNLHELANPNGDHISGVYQFLEKVYESQIFNYGIRQMFDFMVPEPASYIWHLEKTVTNLNLPPPPIDFHNLIPTAEAITVLNYLEFAAKLGVTGVEQPPLNYVKTTSSYVATGEGTESGSPQGAVTKEIVIPPGYKPWNAAISLSALTDNRLAIAVDLGLAKELWEPNDSEYEELVENYRMATKFMFFNTLTGADSYDPQSKLILNAVAYETNSFTILVEAKFQLLTEGFKAWQMRTYDKFLGAYQEILQKYEAKVAELKAEAEAKARNDNARFGAPPSQNVMTVKRELKKHCISIVTRQRFEQAGTAVHDGQNSDPPFFDFPKAAEQGSYTRFFEQAFEWDQMQYVFYPYFWARKETRTSRFTRNETDTQFLEFLQAGSARVVVPVRPGFEHAITHYLECGVIWDGEGEPPEINDPLYVPIITEIQERTGASQGEIAVGEEWKTHVPTPLVILRAREEELPEWERLDKSTWEWQEVEDNGQDVEGHADSRSSHVPQATQER